MNVRPATLNGRFGVIAMLAVLAFIASGCGSPTGAGTFSSDAFPFEFDYPASWTLSQSETTPGQPGMVTVALREPFDQVHVASFGLKKEIPRGEQGNESEVEQIVQRVTQESRGKASDGKPVEYGEAKGYEYVISYKTQSGVQLENRITLLFAGENLIQVSCQSEAENREALDAGCDEVLESLKLS